MAPSDREVEWVLAAGLGPLLYATATQARIDVPARWQDRLLAADLMARLRAASIASASTRVLDILARHSVTPVVLKGLSAAYEIYPQPHLRPMGDIDLLVAGTYEMSDRALVDAGFARSDMPPMHHGPPLHDPTHDVWVELHTELFFPADHPLRRGATFDIQALREHFMTASLQGRAVFRFAPEVQIAYSSSSWMNDLTSQHRVHPSYLASLFDVVLLAKKYADSMRWDRLVALLGTPMARAATFVTLGYLHLHRLARVPSGVLDELLVGQRYVGRFQARCIHGLIDRYLVGGRHWNLPLPPPVPGRYRLAGQWHKRVTGRLGPEY